MKHGNILLYLASAGLLAQAGTFVAGLLPMRSQRSAQHHQRGVEVAQSSLLQGRGTGTGGKWVYDGSSLGWWQRGRDFLVEVRNEMKRVTWPTRREVYATTVVVILTSLFFTRRAALGTTTDTR